MKIITLNLNGVRSAARKGFFDWLKLQDADVVCLQEIRAQESDLGDCLYSPPGYQCFYHFAEKKGYSGVAIYTRHQPDNVTTGLGFGVADQEGRYVAVQLGQYRIASLYMPSGTSGDVRQAIKYDFLDRYEQHLVLEKSKPHKYIICGDMNIAHKEIDLKNWKGNRKNSGFLPEERAWMDKLFGHHAFVDAFREVNQEAEQYTWWSNRGRAWEKNVGWRIDYQIVSDELKKCVKDAEIYKAQRFSDHAPLIMNYEL